LNSSSPGNQLIHVDCNRGNTHTSGELNLTRVDSEHIKGEMNLKSTGDASTAGSAGQNMVMKMSFAGKYLSSDCGDVKPANPGK
jgi:hypothetical protein